MRMAESGLRQGLSDYVVGLRALEDYNALGFLVFKYGPASKVSLLRIAEIVIFINCPLLSPHSDVTNNLGLFF